MVLSFIVEDKDINFTSLQYFEINLVNSSNSLSEILFSKTILAFTKSWLSLFFLFQNKLNIIKINKDAIIPIIVILT